MKNYLQNVSHVFIISVCFYSCYSPRYIYNPPAQNVPLLNKKNDAELSAFYSGSFNLLNKKGDKNYGFDFHSAWAFSKHFSIMINGTLRREKNDANDTYFYGDTSLLSYKIDMAEAAIGYFSSLPENAKMRFQTFAGAALGTLQIKDAYTSNAVFINKYFDSRVTKFFIQPSIIYYPAKYVSAALSSRFTALLFTHIRTNYTKEEQNNYILDSVSVAPVFFWEPALTYTFSLKKIPLKLRLQGALTVLLNHRFIESKSANLAFGIVADLNKKKRPVSSFKN